ncbi:MAG: histidine kinase [Bacteroidales bacterium]|nr:histidine kinase [Bacteroidales bacterium]
MRRNTLPGSRQTELIGAMILVGVLFFIWLGANDFRITPFRLEEMGQVVQRDICSRFYDLSGDGVAEQIHFLDYGDFATIEVYSLEGRLLYLTKLEGKFPHKRYFHIFGDHDLDGKGESYCITRSGDSLFLNQLYNFSNLTSQLDKIYLDTTMQRNGGYDYSMPQGLVADLDGDSLGEVVFGIHGGYSLIPRKIFVYHPETRALQSSRDMGVSYAGWSIFDLDQDGKSELITGSRSTENFGPDENMIFGDHQAGIFIFNSDLSLRISSLLYEEGRPYVTAFPIVSGKDTLLCSLLHMMEAEEHDSLCIYDLSLKHLKSVPVPDKLELRVYIFGAGGDRNYYMGRSSNLYRFDAKRLDISPVKRKGYLLNSREQDPGFDLQYKFLRFNNQITLVDQHLNSCSNELTIPGSILEMNLYSAYGDQERIYALHDDRALTSKMIRLSYRNTYPFRLVFYGLAFLICGILFYAIIWGAHYLYLRRKMFEYRLQLAELKSVHNQMHPHFTFNVLNAIGSFIYSEERDKAYRYLNDVSDMLRVVLDTSHQSLWRLQDELEFIRLYIKLENVRFSGKFIYLEEIDKEVDPESLVPKMMIQTFVENAIRHGLSQKEKEGELKLEVTRTNRSLRITIEDNGIGRIEARQFYRNGSGNGIRFVERYMENYNRIYGKGFAIQISDILDFQGHISGTRVHLILPLQLKTNEV